MKKRLQKYFGMPMLLLFIAGAVTGCQWWEDLGTFRKDQKERVNPNIPEKYLCKACPGRGR